MKRTKFVMLAVVVALVLMGAGYAAWTQVFTISSTVSTGELFVKVAETHTVEVNDGSGTYSDAGNDYLDLGNLITTSASDNAEGTESTLSTLTYDLGKVYPGTRITSVITFQNLGSMKTKTTYDTTGNNAISLSAGNALWTGLEITVNGEPVTGTGTDKLTNLADAIKNAIGELDTNVLKTVTIVQELPIESEDDTENLNLTWTVPLTFEQYNAQAATP